MSTRGVTGSVPAVLPVGVLVNVSIPILVAVFVRIFIGVLVHVFIDVRVDVPVAVAPVGVFVNASIAILVVVFVCIFVNVAIPILVEAPISICSPGRLTHPTRTLGAENLCFVAARVITGCAARLEFPNRQSRGFASAIERAGRNGQRAESAKEQGRERSFHETSCCRRRPTA